MTYTFLLSTLHVCHCVGDYLVLHLLELVRTAFMASTGNVNLVRITGLKALKVMY